MERELKTYRNTTETANLLAVGVGIGIAKEDVGLGELEILALVRGVVVGGHICR